VEIKLYHRASTLQQIKTKKVCGPAHPRHHLTREKIKEKKTGSRGENPAGLTARGPWAKAHEQGFALQN